MKTQAHEGDFTVSPGRSFEDRASGHEPADLLAVFWRYRWAVILPAFAGALVGLLVYSQTPETYRSTTRLMLETDRPAILDSMTGDVVGGVPSTDIVESQLYSDRVVSMAFDDPRMQSFRGQFDGSSANYIATVRESMVLEPEVSDRGTAQSLVMQLHFDNENAELCEASVKSFSTALQTFFNERQKDSRTDLIRLISEAMQELHPKMLDLEQRYRDFRRDAPLAWNTNGEAINPHREQQLFLVKRRSEIFEQLRQKQILLGAVESVAKKSNDPIMALSVVGQLLNMQIRIPETQQSTSRQAARDGDVTLAQIDVDKELIPLMIERNKYAAQFGDNHPTVKQLDTELSVMKAELKRLVQEESEQILKLMKENHQEVIDPTKRAREAIGAVLYAAKSEVELLESQIAEVEEQIAVEKEGSIELAKYEQDNLAMRREIDRTRELLGQLEEQMARVSLTDDQSSSTRVIELTAPSKAYRIGPVLMKLLGIGTFLGLALGSGLALLLEKNSSTFRTSDEISEMLGIPVLTHVPSFKGRLAKAQRGEANPFQDLDPYLAVVHQPASVVSEAIRSCRTSVFFETAGPGCKVIQVTSPLPGDGKSTIAGNLACSIAQSGKRVLAIDCDLRRPQLTDNFALSDSVGVTNALNGECDPLQATHQTPLDTLWVMPSGPIPLNPAEALTLPEMVEMLDYLREHYDYIIIDTPPLLVVTDPSIVASKVDGVVLTLRIRRKSKHNSKEALNILRRIGARVLGVVINNSDEAGTSDGYQGYGYYRYGRYTNRYYRPSNRKGSGNNNSAEGMVVSGRTKPLAKKTVVMTSSNGSHVDEQRKVLSPVYEHSSQPD